MHLGWIAFEVQIHVLLSAVLPLSRLQPGTELLPGSLPGNLAKWKGELAGVPPAFGANLKLTEKVMSGDLERQCCQSYSESIKKEGGQNFPQNKGGAVGWGEGAVSERGSWEAAPPCSLQSLPNNPNCKTGTEAAKPLDLTGTFPSAWDLRVSLENQCGPRPPGTSWTWWQCSRTQDLGTNSTGEHVSGDSGEPP